MRKCTLLFIALTSSTISYGYEVILSEIINNTPNAITFVGKEVAFPMPVPTVPSQPMQSIKAGSKPLSFPIFIPAFSQKIIASQIINKEESEFGAEIFFNFKDKNNNLVSILAQPGRIFKFAPHLGWQREGLDFTDPNATYRVSFTFEGKDGIADAKIKLSASSRRVIKFKQKRNRRRY